MTNRFTELTDDFRSRAKKYSGGRIHFLIDGSAVATEGGLFNKEETDPVTEALSTVKEIKAALPGTNVTAAFWDAKHPSLDINLNASPAAWFNKIPKGGGQMIPALEGIEKGIVSGELQTPLHVVFTVQFGYGADDDETKSALRRLQQTPGVTLDVIIHTDIALQLNRNVLDLSKEDPSKPVGHYKILSPEELRDAIRTAAFTPVENKLKFEDNTAPLATGLKNDVVAPEKASFKKRPL